MIKDLSDRLHVLDQHRQFFEGLLKQKSGAQLQFEPEPGHWNILQVVDHVVKVEQQTLKFLQNFDFSRKDEKVGLKNAINFLLLRIALKSNLKFKVPTQEVVPKAQNIPEVLEAWERVRTDLKNFLDVYPDYRLRNFVFFHPRSGKLNIFQTLDFLLDHMIHHKQQIARIIKNGEYPTG